MGAGGDTPRFPSLIPLTRWISSHRGLAPGVALIPLLLLLSAGLSGCLNLRQTAGPGGDDVADRASLADQTCDFPLPESTKRFRRCDSPLTPASVQADVPPGWLCVGFSPGSVEDTYTFQVFHHPERDQLGVRFAADVEADLSAGWANVSVDGVHRTFNYTTGRRTGFVAFDGPPAGQVEDASIVFTVARITYDSNRTVLEEAEKQPTWVPSIPVGDKSPAHPYWLVHRFVDGDRSYYFSTLDPVNVTYDRWDFRLTIEPYLHGFGWDGDTIPAVQGYTSGSC